MFSKISSLRGYARIKVKGYMPEGFLNICAGMGIELSSVRKADELSLEATLPSTMLDNARQAANRSSCELIVLRRGRAAARLVKRRLFPAILALGLVAVLFWSKFYVWEIELQGSERVSAGKILDALWDAGVRPGAFWPGFSADNIRSEVLFSLPELGWITVNMHGSLAEVIVVERKEKPEMVFEGDSASLVSDRDGFIRKVNVLVGQAAVKPGDVVSKGDVLISGAVESSFSRPRFLRCQGSVEAETNNEYLALLPEKMSHRRYTGEKKERYALIWGNKRINFYSGSSISSAFCDKITSVWNLEVPGLFKLPVSIVRESFRSYEGEDVPMDAYDAGESLRQRLYESLEYQLGDGELISDKLSFGTKDGLIVASLRVRCREEIGFLRPISEAEMAEVQRKYTEKAVDE